MLYSTGIHSMHSMIFRVEVVKPLLKNPHMEGKRAERRKKF